jgi:hypothetical protein
LLLVLAIEVILGSESYGFHDHILLSQTRDSPNVEGQVSVFIATMNRMAQLILQALGFLPDDTNDSQGDYGGIGTYIRTGI